VLPHGVAVYREGSGGGATLTPAPPAHAVQPSTVIHQLNNKPDITLPNTPVSVQFSRAIVSGKPNIRMIQSENFTWIEGTEIRLNSINRRLHWNSVADSDPGSGIDFFRISDPGSQTYRYFWELSDNFWVKSFRILCKLAQIFLLHLFKDKIIFNFLSFYCCFWIRDSGWTKIRIQDPG
jgi:hypothetical protein